VQYLTEQEVHEVVEVVILGLEEAAGVVVEGAEGAVDDKG